MATLTRSGSGYAVNDRRSYDAWGVVRSQQSAGDPKLRYCGSLGQIPDDESGLIYMRARYYEPTSGRFVSEDPARDGGNWFVYGNNNPEAFHDPTGLFVDILCAMSVDDLFEKNNAAVAQHSKGMAKEKLADTMAKKMGQVMGALAASEIDNLRGAQIDGNGYLTFDFGSKGRIGIDFGPRGVKAHGVPHIDILDGATKRIGARRLTS